MSATFFVAIFQQQQKGSPKKVQMRINQDLNFGFLNYDRPIFGLFYFYAKFMSAIFFYAWKSSDQNSSGFEFWLPEIWPAISSDGRHSNSHVFPFSPIFTTLEDHFHISRNHICLSQNLILRILLIISLIYSLLSNIFAPSRLHGKGLNNRFNCKTKDSCDTWIITRGP